MTHLSGLEFVNSRPPSGTSRNQRKWLWPSVCSNYPSASAVPKAKRDHRLAPAQCSLYVAACEGNANPEAAPRIERPTYLTEIFKRASSRQTEPRAGWPAPCTAAPDESVARSARSAIGFTFHRSISTNYTMSRSSQLCFAAVVFLWVSETLCGTGFDSDVEIIRFNRPRPYQSVMINPSEVGGTTRVSILMTLSSRPGESTNFTDWSYVLNLGAEIGRVRSATRKYQ